MEYKMMAGTGLYVSRLCLGTMPFGGQTPEDEAVKMVQFAVDNPLLQRGDARRPPKHPHRARNSQNPQHRKGGIPDRNGLAFGL